MSSPNREDPAGRAAYRRELIGLHRGWRWAGLTLVIAGVAVMFIGGRGFNRASLALLALGWVILIAVIVLRTRHHKRRMRET